MLGSTNGTSTKTYTSPLSSTYNIYGEKRRRPIKVRSMDEAESVPNYRYSEVEEATRRQVKNVVASQMKMNTIGFKPYTLSPSRIDAGRVSKGESVKFTAKLSNHSLDIGRFLVKSTSASVSVKYGHKPLAPGMHAMITIQINTSHVR